MSQLWRSLSPFTRLLAVTVLCASVGGSYLKLRAKPLRTEVVLLRQSERELSAEVQELQHRVLELQREADAAMRWENYARRLSEQSTGRSLQDVLARCASDREPNVKVVRAEFEKRRDRGSLELMHAELVFQGKYAEILQVLDELDRTFPPIELQHVEFRRPDLAHTTPTTAIVATVRGVLHGPR